MREATKVKFKETLEDSVAPASVLAVLLLDAYGMDWFEWDVGVLRDELSRTFHASIPRVNMDKIMCLSRGLTTDAVSTDWVVFNQTAEAFSHDPISYDELDEATVEQIAWALFECYSLGIVDDEAEFSDEVIAYIRTLLRYHGLSVNLPWAAFDTSVEIEDTDDPEITQARLRRDTEILEDINKHIRIRWADVLNRINRLPLETLDRESWQKFLKKNSPVLASASKA